MKKTVLVLVLVAAALFSYSKLRGGSSDEAEVDDSNLVLDRIWIDHIPRNDRDVINVFVAITEEPFGVFQASSQWKGSYELFRYEAHGDEIRVLFPQSNEREKVKTRATKCNERQMDYCLELDGSSRGVKKYYSRKGWEIEKNATADQVRRKVEALVATEANRSN